MRLLSPFPMVRSLFRILWLLIPIRMIYFLSKLKDTQIKTRNIGYKSGKKIYAATHGKIYVYCDRSSFMKKLIGEVNQALKDFHYSSCFSNYEDVKNGKRGADGSIWIQKRV